MRILLVMVSVMLCAIPAYAQVTNWPRKIESEKEIIRRDRMVALAIGNLNKGNYQVVEQSIYVLEHRGGEATPLLIDALPDNFDDDVRLTQNIFYTLGRLGKHAHRGVATLMRGLGSDNADTRAVAALSLAKIGPKAQQSVSLLIKMLFDDDAWVSASSERALRAIRTPRAMAAVAEYRESEQRKAAKKENAAPSAG